MNYYIEELFKLIVTIVPVLVITIFFHELGHYLAARFSGYKVTSFVIGAKARFCRRFNSLLYFRFKETRFFINPLLPLGGAVLIKKIDDNIPKIIILAGPLMNLLVAIVSFTLLYLNGFFDNYQIFRYKTTIEQILEALLLTNFIAFVGNLIPFSVTDGAFFFNKKKISDSKDKVLKISSSMIKRKTND